jgi:hypothetical protein
VLTDLGCSSPVETAGPAGEWELECPVETHLGAALLHIRATHTGHSGQEAQWSWSGLFTVWTT